MTRASAALLVAAVLAVGAAAGFDAAVPPPPVEAPAPTPVAPAAAGIWYCPVTAASDEAATLSIAAVGDAASAVRVVRYSEAGPVDDPVVTVAPGEALDVVLAPGEASRPVAVRWAGGPAAVTWRVDGATDGAAGACLPAPSATWHLTGFDTTLGSAATLHLFNPFAEDAVVSVVLATLEGAVRLRLAERIAVPGGSAVRVALRDLAPEEPDLGATVEVVTGRVVAGGEQVLAPPEGVSGPRGRAVVPAATAPSSGWSFAFARTEEAAVSWLSVQNPGLREAAVEVRVSDPRPDGLALLSEVSVPAGGIVRIDLAETSATAEFAVGLAVVNDEPVVVTRLTGLRTQGGRRGVAISLGAPDAAVSWALPGGGTAGRDGRLSIYNPGAESATVTVAAAGAPTEWSAIAVGPNGRATVELSQAGEDVPTLPVRITADRPVVPELRMIADGESLGFTTVVGLPALAWTGPISGPSVRRDPSLAGRPLLPTGPRTPPAPTPDAVPPSSTTPVVPNDG